MQRAYIGHACMQQQQQQQNKNHIMQAHTKKQQQPQLPSAISVPTIVTKTKKPAALTVWRASCHNSRLL